jgi:hypothetical protein
VSIQNASLLYTGFEARLGIDFSAASMSANAAFDAEVINAGFGTKIPDMNYDDYANLDVKGKVVIVKRHLPENTLPVEKQKEFSDLFFKIGLARERGAAAVIFWIDDERGGDTLPDLTKQYRITSIPVLNATRSLVQTWLSASQPLRVQGNVALKKSFSPAYNIVGSLGGACANGANTVVLGAHLDHLGMGDDNSLEPTQKGLHPGADDNASGVAAMLEAAWIIRSQNSDVALETQCFVFTAFAAEEQGLVGSNALVSAWRKMNWMPKAMINLDMVGRLRNNNVAVFGANSAREWPLLLTEQFEKEGLQGSLSSEDGLGKSDHVAFLIASVPSLFLHTGAHADYHRTTDTADKLNADGAVRIARMAAVTAMRVANPSQKLEYTIPPQKDTGGDLPTWGAYLGTMPDYTGGNPDLKGVLLTGAVPGSPAEKAGVKPGDVLLAIDARPTQNIDDFMLVLRSLHPGDRIVLRILRGSEVVALPTVVGSRKR